MDGLIAFIMLLWQLPQILLGFLVRIICRTSLIRRSGYVRFYSWGLRSGLSLGWFCFVPKDAPERMIRHEFGHTVQSRLLGPLYMPIIGIPSFIWATLLSLGVLKGCDPLSFYTEKWAEKCGSRLL